MPDPSSTSLATDLARLIRDVPDFPRPGVTFKDITPILHDVGIFRRVIEALAAPWRTEGITHVVAIESRGFLFGAPVALELRAALVPARKPGKLPRMRVTENYSLEYGTDALEVHHDAIGPVARVLIVDDLLATGGTAAAACRLVDRCGGQVVGLGVVIGLDFLPWRAALAGRRVETLVSF